MMKSNSATPAPDTPSDQGIRKAESGAVSMRKRRNFAPTYKVPRFVPGIPDIGRCEGPYLVCGRVPNMAELEQLAGLGWLVHADGRYPVLRSEGATVRWAASWFGDGVEVDEAIALWGRLERFVRRAFDPGARPIGAPATTGRDLWLRTLGPAAQFPTLPGELQTLIRDTSGQGRIQMLIQRADTVPAIVEYDQRLAYAALMRGLPTGRPSYTDDHREAGAIFAREPFTPARYLVEWRAPARWEHPGILPALSTIDTGPSWPLDGAGWVDGAELHLAARNGWEYHVAEALTWPSTGDPFRGWTDRLIGAIGETSPRWRACIRALLLHTVGAMYGRDRTVTVFGANPPDHAEALQLLPSGSFRWIEREPAVWPETHHPEWSAHVWARARLRLMDAPGAYLGDGSPGPRVGALHVPAEHLVAFRTDAIYLTHDPRWYDDGRPGRFVHKMTARGVRAWPAGHADLLAIKAGAGRLSRELEVNE